MEEELQNVIWKNEDYHARKFLGKTSKIGTNKQNVRARARKYNLCLYVVPLLKMPLTIRVKVAKMGNSLRMTIPVDVARTLDIKDGDFVEIGITDSQMIVKKASL